MRNAINWFDIPTEDFDRARRFYSRILGVELKVTEMGGQPIALFPIDPDGEVGGSLVPPAPDEVPSGMGPRVYLACDDRIEEVLKRVEPAGGQVVRERFSIPQADFAVIRDTEGNTVGLCRLKSPA